MSNIFPIPRPPVPPAWCGHPGHPDWCDCGCGPPCPPSTVDAWREMARFKEMLRCIIDEMGITAGPQVGVIDGSDAKPGQVGEYIILTQTAQYAGNPQITTVNVTGGVLPPGDWNITSWLAFTTAIGQSFFRLSPVPAGMSNNMEGIQFVSAVGGGVVVAIIPGIAARGNFSVPTLLPFTIMVDQTSDTSLTAGTATLTIEARRAR